MICGLFWIVVTSCVWVKYPGIAKSLHDQGHALVAKLWKQISDR